MSKPSLSFLKNQGSYAVGDIVPVDIAISTGKENVISADVYLKYNSEFLELASSVPDIVKTDLFSMVSGKNINENLFYLYAINQKPVQAQHQKLATVYFRAKKEGAIELSYLCDISKTSAIISSDNNFKNVIDCQSTSFHTVKLQLKNSNQVLGANNQFTKTQTVLLFTATVFAISLFLILFYRYKKLINKIPKN